MEKFQSRFELTRRADPEEWSVIKWSLRTRI